MSPNTAQGSKRRRKSMVPPRHRASNPPDPRQTVRRVTGAAIGIAGLLHASDGIVNRSNSGLALRIVHQNAAGLTALTVQEDLVVATGGATA